MCGIAGLIDSSATDKDIAATVRKMTAVLAHRGPDADGLWFDRDAGVALGHRRLSILDLSKAGAQPMISANGRWVITYNGEVYNAPDLRIELEAKGATFRGHSDTEVLLEACATWGVRAAVERLIGMYAFAIWDREDRVLYLVRDRLGIKPLYWSQYRGNVFFASELKALREHTDWPVEVDRDALSAYMRFLCVPSRRTIYRNVWKLEPGCMLVVGGSREPRIERYWDMRTVAQHGMSRRLDCSDEEAIEALARELSDAVSRRMVSDVPLGAFLSGGIDSSTVVALMQANSTRPVRTFSIGFHEDGYNEAEHAGKVARHLGTDHIELYVEPGHAIDAVPRLSEIYDEPFADSSQIPTLLISELTRRHVTVALSGDGGDELFAGYLRYRQARSLNRICRIFPSVARTGMAQAIRILSPAQWTALAGHLPSGLRLPRPGEKLHKLAQILAGEPESLYLRMRSQWVEPDRLVCGGTEADSDVREDDPGLLVPDYVERLQYLDTRSYLPDDILTKVDRASMAVSLEVRVPLLDHRVVAFAWSLAPAMKLRAGVGKWALRQLLYRYVPRELVDRPKMGFDVPIGAWLRGPLRGWAEDLLSEEAIRKDGYLDSGRVQDCWRAHLDGRTDNPYPLWGVLMFQMWKRRWM